MAQVALGGTVLFKIDGTQYSAKGKFAYSTLKTKKTGVVGQDGPHGFNEMPVLPYIKGTITDIGAVSVQQLQNITDSTITLECRNGKVVILRDAWLEGEVEVNTEEGEYGVEFRGLDANEQVAT